MKKILKYKYVILINIFVIITFIFIQKTLGLYGFDDYISNSYTFNPNNHMLNLFIEIKNRSEWNSRIGELLYFTLGHLFNKNIHYILSGIRLSIFYNLIFIYIYGKNYKNKILTINYILIIIISHILTITFNPTLSDAFIWLAGNYNHLLGLNLLLINALPFRLLLDDINILNKKRIIIPFLLLSIISAFNIEHLVPSILLYEGLILLRIKINNKINIKEFLKKYIIYLMSILQTTISFLFFIFISRYRIGYYDEVIIKNNFIIDTIVQYRYILLILLIIIYYILLKNKTLKNVLKLDKLLLILTSIFSLVIIYFSKTYYDKRMTLYLFFSLTVLITYLISKHLKKKYYKIIITISIIITIITTINAISFYKDLNKYNKIRYNYIKEQYKQSNIINCPVYDYKNKEKYFFISRLSETEYRFCEERYIKKILNIDDEEKIIIKTTTNKIR